MFPYFLFVFLLSTSLLMCVTQAEMETHDEFDETQAVKPEGKSEEESTHKTTTDAEIITFAEMIDEAIDETKYDVIVDIVIETNLTDRLRIVEAYRHIYKKDLDEQFKTLGNKDFVELITGLFVSKSVFLATQLWQAMDGLGTTESTLTDILCCLTASELEGLMSAYHEHFNSDLAKDVTSETSGDYGTLLSQLVNARHDDETDIKTFKIRVADAVTRLNPGVPISFRTTTKKPKLLAFTKMFQSKKQKVEDLYVNIPSVIHVFSSNSFAVIAKASNTFEKSTGYQLQETILQSTTQDFQELLINILYFAEDGMEFYARRINTGLNRYMHKHKPLTRAIVMLSHVELSSLVETYENIFHRKIVNMLEASSKDPYKSAVVRILNSCDK